MNRTRVFLAAVAISAVLIPGLASADPVSIVYEGDDFPENVGWQRFTQYGGSQRSLSDGVLTLNSTTNPDAVDYYANPWTHDPLPGEIFVADVLLRVTYADIFPKSSFVVARADTYGYVQVAIGYDSLIVLPYWAEIPLTPAVWHMITLRSRDMLTFDLFVDETFVHHGQFEAETLNQGFCAFGDSFRPVLSRTEWDYARFAIIPEPVSLICLLPLWLLFARVIRTRKSLSILASALLISGLASADPVTVVYEGDDFPENVGWQRFTQFGGSQRSLSDGVLTLNSTNNADAVDYYQQPWLSDLPPGAIFTVEVRIRVTQGDFFPKSSFGIARAESPGWVELAIGYDSLIVLPFWAEIPLTPASWHTIALRSLDMNVFDLFVDGTFVHHGRFETETLNQGFCWFGDSFGRVLSHTEWDYARFAIAVPELSARSGIIMASVLLLERGRAYRMRRCMHREHKISRAVYWHRMFRGFDL